MDVLSLHPRSISRAQIVNLAVVQVAVAVGEQVGDLPRTGLGGINHPLRCQSLKLTIVSNQEQFLPEQNPTDEMVGARIARLELVARLDDAVHLRVQASLYVPKGIDNLTQAERADDECDVDPPASCASAVLSTSTRPVVLIARLCRSQSPTSPRKRCSSISLIGCLSFTGVRAGRGLSHGLEDGPFPGGRHGSPERINPAELRYQVGALPAQARFLAAYAGPGDCELRGEGKVEVGERQRCARSGVGGEGSVSKRFIDSLQVVRSPKNSRTRAKYIGQTLLFCRQNTPYALG